MKHDVKIKLTGTQPLLMSNGQVVDELNPWKKKIDAATVRAKKAKTDKAIIEADRLRWLGAVYADKDGYPVLPIDNFLACLTKAARLFRLGQKVAAGVYVMDGSRLRFNGSGEGQTVEQLADNPDYQHRKRTKRGVIAHRPIFQSWSAEFDVMFDDEIIDREDFDMILETAGKVGIGAWTARFGKFDAEVVA